MQQAERLLVAAGLCVRRAVRCHCGRTGLSALHRLGRAALGMYSRAAGGAGKLNWGRRTVFSGLRTFSAARAQTWSLHAHAGTPVYLLSVCAPVNHTRVLDKGDDDTDSRLSTEHVPGRHVPGGWSRMG